MLALEVGPVDDGAQDISERDDAYELTLARIQCIKHLAAAAGQGWGWGEVAEGWSRWQWHTSETETAYRVSV